MEEEIWVPVRGFEDCYEVSSLGKVRSVDRQRRAAFGGVKTLKGKLLAPRTVFGGYVSVIFYRDECHKVWSVHRLVATHFLPNPEGLPEVHHLDFDRTNNRASNLEWCTRADNARHSQKAGRFSASMRLKVAKLHEDDIPAIRELAEHRLTHGEIAAVFGVSASLIGRVLNGDRWSDVNDKETHDATEAEIHPPTNQYVDCERTERGVATRPSRSPRAVRVPHRDSTRWLPELSVGVAGHGDRVGIPSGDHMSVKAVRGLRENETGARWHVVEAWRWDSTKETVVAVCKSREKAEGIARQMRKGNHRTTLFVREVAA